MAFVVPDKGYTTNDLRFLKLATETTGLNASILKRPLLENSEKGIAEASRSCFCKGKRNQCKSAVHCSLLIFHKEHEQ
jgi:hypothetical protein